MAYYRKFAKFSVEAYALLTEPNMYPEHPYREVRSSKTLRANSTFSAKLTGWQLAKRALVIYICLKHLLMLTIQYVFDILKIRHQRQVFALNGQHHQYQQAISSLNSSWPPSNVISEQEKTTLRVRVSLLEEQMTFWKWILKSVGAPFIDIGLVIECSEYFLIMGSIALIVATEVYSRWIGPLDIGLLRRILDKTREQVYIDLLIKEECAKALQSSTWLLVSELLIKRFERIEEKVDGICSRPKLIGAVNAASGSRALRLTGNSCTLAELIEHLKRDNSLNLAHHGDNWLNVISMIWTWAVLAMTIGGFALNFSFILIWFKYYYQPSTGLSPMDWFGFVEFEIIAALVTFFYAFCAPTMLCVFIDQTYGTKKLRQDLENGIRTNELAYEEINMLLEQKHQFNPNQIFLQIQDMTIDNESDRYLDEAIERINENMLRIIMRYRLFKRQFFPMKHYYCHAYKVVGVFLTTYPIYVVFHLVYLNGINCLFLIATVWVYILLQNCGSLPVCAYHAQLQHLFNRLFVLMGHVDRIQAQRSIYNPRIVSLVRQEVTEPEIEMEKLSVLMFSYVLDYTHLLRLYSWTALLTAYGILVSQRRSDDNINGASRERMILGIFG